MKMLYYGSRPEEQWRDTVIEEEGEKGEVKLPKKTEMEAGESNSYGR